MNHTATATAREKELDLLETIYRARRPTPQRALADSIGVSLGMANGILKRMARKGWLKIRKVNNRNIQYAVSARGIEAIARRSYAYLRRTIGYVVQYKEAITELVHDAISNGCTEVVLIGESELDFIFEQACESAGARLRVVSLPAVSQLAESRTQLVVLSEQVVDLPVEIPGAVALRSLLVAR